MKYITIKNNFEKKNGGRTGHRIKDIMSLYILSFFVKDLQVVPNPSWHIKQHLIKFKCENLNTSSLKTISIHKFARKPRQFCEFMDLINYINQSEDNTFFHMDTRMLLLPKHLTDWYNDGHISSDIFNDKFIPLFRKLYNDENVEIKEQLAFHVRRGDIYDPGKIYYRHFDFMKWKATYIEKRILDFKKHNQDVPIKIFTEKNFSDDLNYLQSKFSKLEILRGDEETLKNDIHEMVNSKFFIPCNSGLSTSIAYLCNGKVMIDSEKPLKHFHTKIIW